MPTKKLNLDALTLESFVTTTAQVRGGLGSNVAGCQFVTDPSPGCNNPTGTFCQQYSLDGGVACVESHTCPPV